MYLRSLPVYSVSLIQIPTPVSTTALTRTSLSALSFVVQQISFSVSRTLSICTTHFRNFLLALLWTNSIVVTPSTSSKSISCSSCSVANQWRRQRRWRFHYLPGYGRRRRLYLPSWGAWFHVVCRAQYRRIKVEPQLAGQDQLGDAAHDSG